MTSYEDDHRSKGRRPLGDFFASHGIDRAIAPGATVGAQGDAVRYVYKLQRGWVRMCIYTADGERKVLQFLSPGDYFGLSGSARWATAYEAVDLAIVRAVPVSEFERSLATDTGLQKDVRHVMRQKLARHTALLVRTAHTSAVDRVRSFLRDFAQRRRSQDYIALPMGRRDIADHLGLSMETVSRSISALRDSGEIAMKGASFFKIPVPAPSGCERDRLADVA